MAHRRRARRGSITKFSHDADRREVPRRSPRAETAEKITHWVGYTVLARARQDAPSLRQDTRWSMQYDRLEIQLPRYTI